MGVTIQESELKLVDPEARNRIRRTRVLSGAIGVGLVVFAALATARGADRARSPLDARQHVQDTATLALTEGNRSPQVLQNLVRLRSELGQRPLDSKSRVQYAALLLSMTRKLSDTRAAAFHAGLAAELAPVTVPVLELAARILARSGDDARALTHAREMFEFDPEAAATLLLTLEDNLVQGVSAGLADSPAAWRAWADALSDAGRREESTSFLRQAAERWPDDLDLRLALARLATRAGDWGELERWVGDDRLPVEGRGPELLAFRARLHAERDIPDAAERDLANALAAARNSPSVLLLAGDVQQRLGSIERARQSWNQALFRLKPERKSTRVALFVRLADLEETAGRASVALRHWRAVLELDPSHVRAQRRVSELTGSP